MREDNIGQHLFTAELWGDLNLSTALHPGTEAARERSMAWLRTHNFFGSETAEKWYISWDLEGLIGMAYPYADDRGLDLCNQATAFMTVFDDQFEGRPGDSSAASTAMVRTYLDILDGRPGASRTSPLGTMLTEIWHDWTTAPLSPEWHARTRNDWVYCLTSMAHERALLRTGSPLLPDQYIHLRRGTSYMPLFLDLIELADGIECPRMLIHSPSFQILRRITMDVVNFMNDILSLHKEVSRGDNNNIVLTTQHERHCTLDQSITHVCDDIREKIRRFTELKQGVPDLCAQLGLTDTETSAALHHSHALELWIGSYDPWQRRSPRYTQAFTQRPPGEDWAFPLGKVRTA